MKRAITYCLVFVLVFLFISVPSARSQHIDSMINVYGERYPQEKIYIHFDKPAYNTGETIWFKAYLFAGIVPSGISRNFYAELLDPNSGRVIQQRLLPIFEGSAGGSFDLPVALSNTSLVFRAYTTWMLNFDTTFLYTKTIPILNKKAPAGTLPPKQVTTLRFFPEGGDMVDGLESTVAFKATDIYGFPVEVSGIIKDASGATVTSFASSHDGMGRLTLEPKAGAVYTAEWKDEKKQSYKTTLPKSKPGGVVLQVGQVGNRVTFLVKRNMDAPDNLRNLYMLGYFNQQVVYKARLNLKENAVISGNIPIDGLPTGILQMTLFDAGWNAQAERITFVNKDDYFFSTRITPTNKSMERRGKNTIVIEVPDTIKTNMSISITDAGVSKTDPDGDNIVSHLLLSGDLKGYVHNPYYYFNGNDDTIRSQLDLVMLTNGWRRYKWEDLAAGKLPTIKYPRENYLAVKAELAGVTASQIPKNTLLNVFLEAKDSSRQLFLLNVNDQGKFLQDGLIFFDTVKVYYQFNNNKELANRGVMNFSNGTWKGFSFVKPDTFWRIPVPIDTSVLSRGRFFATEADRIRPELEKKVKLLDAVVVKAKTKSREQILDDRYSSGLFKGGDATTFDMNDPSASGAMNIFQYLQGRVAGLQIVTGGAGGGTSLSWRGSTPTVFLNEMQTDIQGIENIPVSDIAYVKVFRPPFFGAPGGGAGGGIAIYTKKGEDRTNTNTGGGLEKGKLVGYAPPKEFYSPDYTKENPLNDVPDVRTTLFWAPYILTDAQGRKVTINFYNNDVSKRLRIVLEGMDVEGRLTRVEKIID